MGRRRISPLDRIEGSHADAQAAFGRLLGPARGGAGRAELVSAVVVCGVVLAGAAGLLASRSLAGALWCATGLVALISALRSLLAGAPVDRADALRQRLRTRWLERAMAGAVRQRPPDLAQRQRELRERLGAMGAGPRFSAGGGVRAVWALAAALAMFGAGIGSLVMGAAERRQARAAAELDQEDATGWVAVQSANDAALAARDLSGQLVAGTFAVAGIVAAAAFGQVLLAGELARRRMLRGTCPECGYDLQGAPSAVDSALVGAECGPERCPECASPWPAVAPATDGEIVARARR